MATATLSAVSYIYTDIEVLEDESLATPEIVGEVVGKGQIEGVLEAPPDGYVYTSVVVLENENLLGTMGEITSKGEITGTLEVGGPPEGKGWVIVDGLPWDPAHKSVLEDADPPAVEGDAIEYDLETAPGGFSITMYPDGTFAFSSGDDYTSQTFEYSLYRQDTSQWYGPETVSIPAPPSDIVGEISGKGQIEPSDEVLDDRTLSLAAIESGQDTAEINVNVIVNLEFNSTETGDDVVNIEQEGFVYEVEWRELGSEILTGSAGGITNLYYDVENLDPNTEYEGRVRVTDGVWSAWEPMQTLALSSNLTLEAVEVGNDSTEINTKVGNNLTFESTEIGDDNCVITATSVVSAELDSTELGNDVVEINLGSSRILTLNAVEVGNDVSSISGTVANNLSLDSTESGDDVCSIDVNVVVGVELNGVEEGDDTASITANVGNSLELNSTEQGDDVVSITGLVAFEGIVGSFAAVEVGDDVSAIEADITNNLTLSSTESGDDTASISGAAENNLTLGATEQNNDVVSINASSARVLTLNATEVGNDTVNVVGDVVNSLALSSTEEGDDTTSVTATNPVSAELTSTEEGNDVVAITGLIAYEGRVASLAAQEVGDDTISVNLGVGNDLTLNGLESTQDALDVQATVGNSLTLDSTEVGNDVVSITGARVPVNASLAAVEAGDDTVNVNLDNIVDVQIGVVEQGNDLVEVEGKVALSLIVNVQDTEHDTCSINGHVLNRATISCQEVGDDVANIRLVEFILGRVINPSSRTRTQKLHTNSSTVRYGTMRK